jgi:hypothetical protein
LPTISDGLLGVISTALVRNKVFADDSNYFANPTDLSRQARFEILSGPLNVTLKLQATPTANRTLIFPDADDTLVGRATTDTLTNKTLTGATISGATNTITNIGVASGGTGVATLTSGNFLVGAGTGAVTTDKVAPAGVVVGTTDSQTLTNKVMTSNTNNVGARGLWSNNGATLTSTYGSGAPASGQVLTARINPVTIVVEAVWQNPAVQYLMRVEPSASQSVPGTAGGGTFVVDSSQMGTGMLITVVDQAAYYVVYSAEFSHSSSTGLCRFTIYVNGIAQTDFARVVTSGTINGVRSIVLSGIVSANAGNVISIRYSTNTNNLTILPRRTIIAIKAVV